MNEQAQHGADTKLDLELVRLWEEHVRHEFVTRSTDDTLDTMVEDAYVDHVPVLTGGCGQAELRAFYATHFIPKMPPDMEMVPVSRTIGTDQLVDEMVSKFTHSLEMDWMLPGNSANWPASGSSVGRNRPISRRQVGPRAYLLGPSLGAGPIGITRPREAPGCGRGKRPKGARSRRAGQCAYATWTGLKHSARKIGSQSAAKGPVQQSGTAVRCAATALHFPFSKTRVAVKSIFGAMG
jgi:hypothetical protein